MGQKNYLLLNWEFPSLLPTVKQPIKSCFLNKNK